jgi:GlpG protein
MRQIGQLTDAAQARVFGDFLLAQGIRNELEGEADGSWAIWIRDEDQMATARTWLEKFQQNPESAEFRAAPAEAAKKRAAEAKERDEYGKRIRTRRSMFPKLGGYGVGILTYALILACLIVALYSKLGSDREFLRHLLIWDPENGRDGFLPDVFAGEIWRLFTPIIIHFGPIHLIFNLMLLYQLGCMIEGRRSSWLLAGLVAVIAAVSNFAQFFFSHSPYFGGMSGVVYGLAGYVWMMGKYHPASGVGLNSQSATILMIWLVVCYTGIVGNVANTAHLVGLIVGVIWGRAAAYFASRRSE